MLVQFAARLKCAQTLPSAPRQSAVQSAPMHECGTTWKERLEAVPDALEHRWV